MDKKKYEDRDYNPLVGAAVSEWNAYKGLTLFDQYAGQAMQGLSSDGLIGIEDMPEVAKDSDYMAEAMLDRRAKMLGIDKMLVMQDRMNKRRKGME